MMGKDSCHRQPRAYISCVVNGGEHWPVCWVRELSQQRSCCSRNKTTAETDAKSPDDEHGQVDGKTLNQCSTDDYDGADKDRNASSVFVGNVGSQGQRDRAANDLHVNHETKHGSNRVVEICKSISGQLQRVPDTKGKPRSFELSSVHVLVRTFLPVLERLHAVQHAAIEPTDVTREEGDQEHDVQLDKVRNFPP